MTVPALKDLLKPMGLKTARLKKDLIEQILAEGAQIQVEAPHHPAEGGHQVAELDHPLERAVLREIFMDIWNDQGKNGLSLRGIFTALFEDLEEAVPMEGTTPVDVANVARDLIVSLL